MRDVPVETAVNVCYGGVPYAVMMTTPADLEDFAYGFSLTEGVIALASDIAGIAIHPEPRGLELHVRIAPGRARPGVMRERNTAGRTGCGICGIDQLDAVPLTAVRARSERSAIANIDPAAVQRALGAIEAAQVLNHATHAVHAAAWCLADGTLVAIREDVGRHNALDKVIGALLRGGHEPGDGFFVITSRCSFEMVEKAAAFGAATIVAISAPTSLAIERATLHGIAMLAVARSDSALAFTGADRVVAATPQAGDLP